MSVLYTERGSTVYNIMIVYILCLGVGFIGRNLVQYLVENQLASKIRVADKVPPSTGWLNDRHKVYIPTTFIIYSYLWFVDINRQVYMYL